MSRLLLWIAFFWLTGPAGTPATAQETPDWNSARELAPGIRLHQDALTSPRPIRRHVVRIDLQQPGLRFTTTPRLENWQSNSRETRRQTARNFLRSERECQRPVMLAFNADAFSPWPVPFDQETETNLQGFAVNNEQLVSPGAGTPSFIRTKSGVGRMQVTAAATTGEDIEVAVSGFAFCLLDGAVQPSGDDLHPRTVLGLSADGAAAGACGGRSPAFQRGGDHSRTGPVVTGTGCRRRDQSGRRWLVHALLVEPAAARRRQIRTAQPPSRQRPETAQPNR